jgi:hypothetical protein
MRVAQVVLVVQAAAVLYLQAVLEVLELLGRGTRVALAEQALLEFSNITVVAAEQGLLVQA